MIDPQVPAEISDQLRSAPTGSLVPFGARTPAVVLLPRRRNRALTPQGTKAIITAVLSAAFLAATIVALAGAASTHAAGYVVLGMVAAVISFNRFLAAVPAVGDARRSGWRQPPSIADPSHPALDGLPVVTAYHRRYVLPSQDMDAEARAVWTRAVDAVRKLRQSPVVRLGLVDSVQVTTVLPYCLWEVAERLARLSALRRQHKAILRGVDANDPDVATVLAPQLRAHELASADIERRVRQLEAFADLVSQADTARRQERAVRRLAKLNDSHQELLAHVGENPGDDAIVEHISLDVQAIIDQAKEAVRQANEAGRNLVLP